MSARDELADILHGKGAYCGSCGYEDGRCSDCKEVLTGYADAILAAGYRRPRAITTAEELDALPVGSIILDSDPDALLKVEGGKWRSLTDPEQPYGSGYITLPATFLGDDA